MHLSAAKNAYILTPRLDFYATAWISVLSCLYELQSIIVRNRGNILSKCKYREMYMQKRILINSDMQI